MEFRPIWNYTTGCQKTLALKRLHGAILEGMAATSYKSRRSPMPLGIQDDKPKGSVEEAVANHH